MWLTTSFWWGAFVQRYDARQIQALSSIENRLFDLVDALGQERKHLFRLLNQDQVSVQTQPHYAKVADNSDKVFLKALEAMSTDPVPLMLGTRADLLRDNIELNTEALKLLNETLVFHRTELNSLLAYALNADLSDLAIPYFDHYSNLINAIATVRRDVQFAPSITSQKAQYHTRFIDSTWVLKESNLQIVALLENILMNAKYGNANVDLHEHYKLLQKLNYRIELAVEEISLLGRHYQFSESIEAKKKVVFAQYFDHYLVLSNSLIESLLDNAFAAESLESWMNCGPIPRGIVFRK